MLNNQSKNSHLTFSSEVIPERRAKADINSNESTNLFYDCHVFQLRQVMNQSLSISTKQSMMIDRSKEEAVT